MGVDIDLCSRFSFLCDHPKFSEQKTTWTESYLEYLLQVEASHPEEYDSFKPLISQDARVFFGPIVSHGGVVSSETFATDLLSLDRNILAIDTESAGVFEQANSFDTPAITVRGVSDFADSKKNELETLSKNHVRSIAAMNAAFYIYAQLESSTIASYLKNRREQIAGSSSDGRALKRAEDPLDALLRDIEQEVDAQLKETCPAYRHKPRRSPLPSPRFLRMNSETHLEKSEDWDAPTEISEAIEKYERVLISLEPTYPDQALPWVIADTILRTNGPRTYVPVVVHGEQVSPHRFQLHRLLQKHLADEVGSHSVTPVIVLDDPNIQSSTRRKALISQANANPEVRFVVILKKHNSSVTSASFAESFNCQRFSIASFSLGALSNFVAGNFGYRLPEAAVLAAKLNDTFEQYNMHAHPSYFAGISPESLAALMAANRRGELIQLAVDAALMVMVAEDEEDVQVSKRWRKDFLKDIIVRQYVKQKNVDEAGAIQVAHKAAENRDVDIRPIEFVQSFVKAGIIEFVDGRVEFSLVYVRDYLLAEFLHENPEEAKAYFELREVNEDYNVLDMYAELGASTEIVEQSSQLIERDIKWLNESRPGTIDNLILNAIQLSKINSLNRFIHRGENVLKTIAYVGENPEDLERKQHLIDLRRSASQRLEQRVDEEREVGARENGEVSKSSASHRTSGESPQDVAEGATETPVSPHRILAHWLAGCIILERERTD